MKLFELQSTAELNELERQLDKMFATLGIDVEFSMHFKERVLGRERSVSVEEIIQSFAQLKTKYKQRLLKAKKQPNYSAVLRDFDQDLNIVFGIKQTDQGSELINITIKQKDPSTFVTSQAGGDDLRIGSKRVREEFENDGAVEAPPDGDQDQIQPDIEKEKILKVGRGKNHKKAKRIAANARTSARAADQEISSDNPNQPHHGGYNTDNNFRLVT